MGFNDIFVNALSFEPGSQADIDVFEEVDGEFKKDFAQQLENSLRSHLEPGLGGTKAIQAQMVQVKEEDGTIVVRSVDQAEPLQVDRATDEHTESIDDLFSISLENVPKSYLTEDGEEGVSFRVVSEANLFGSPERDSQVIDEKVTEILDGGLADEFERATHKVKTRYPNSNG